MIEQNRKEFYRPRNESAAVSIRRCQDANTITISKYGLSKTIKFSLVSNIL